jgi:hypothetical protein
LGCDGGIEREIRERKGGEGDDDDSINLMTW